MTVHAGALESVLLPAGSANGLPNAAYTDPRWLGDEAKIFFAGWAGIGFAKDLSEPAMAMPVDFLGQPLVVIRDREGALRVFENVCRHRGMVLSRRRRGFAGRSDAPTIPGAMAWTAASAPRRMSAARVRTRIRASTATSWG